MRSKLYSNLLPTDPQSAASELHRQQNVDRQRCRQRFHVSGDDVNTMMKEFISARGGVTICPPAYAALSHQYDV